MNSLALTETGFQWVSAKPFPRASGALNSRTNGAEFSAPSSSSLERLGLNCEIPGSLSLKQG